MHHGTCVTHVPWCMPGSLTNGFLWRRSQGTRSRHSRRMRNPQYYVSGKRPMTCHVPCLTDSPAATRRGLCSSLGHERLATNTPDEGLRSCRPEYEPVDEQFGHNRKWLWLRLIDNNIHLGWRTIHAHGWWWMDRGSCQGHAWYIIARKNVVPLGSLSEVMRFTDLIGQGYFTGDICTLSQVLVVLLFWL